MNERKPSPPPTPRAKSSFDLKETDGKKLVISADEWAKEWKIAQLTSSQLRNYYNEVVAIYNKALETKDWKEIQLEFALLKARAAYALRESASKKEAMVAFLQSGVNEVESIEDLIKFKYYFEAALCLFYYYEKNWR